MGKKIRDADQAAASKKLGPGRGNAQTTPACGKEQQVLRK
jgi:hypothetical protein